MNDVGDTSFLSDLQKALSFCVSTMREIYELGPGQGAGLPRGLHETGAENESERVGERGSERGSERAREGSKEGEAALGIKMTDALV